MQSFVPSATNTIAKVVVYIKKVGDPNNLTIKIVSDNNGVPSKTVLASGNISASTITGSYNWIESGLDSNPTLNAGQKYWLILVANVNSNKYYYWGLDTNNGYANNIGMYSDNWSAGNPDWTAAGGDFNFKIYMGATVTGLSDITVNGNAKALNDQLYNPETPTFKRQAPAQLVARNPNTLAFTAAISYFNARL